MTKVDRNRFRGKSTTAMQETLENSAPQSKFPKYYEMIEGDNIIRLAPPHNGDDAWAEPKKTSWLPYYKEDEETGKEVRRVRPLFCADIHGNEKQKALGDPLLKYISLVDKELTDTCSTEQREEKLRAIYGYRTKQKFVGGIFPSLEYVAYGWVGSPLYRIAFKQSWMSIINSLTRDEEGEEGSQINALTDPDYGVNLVTTVNSKTKKSSDKYKHKRGLRPKPLTDEQINELLEKESLIEIFHNKYDMDTLDKVLEGIAIVDQENDYGMFDNPEFVEFIEEFRTVTSSADETDDGTGKGDAVPNEEIVDVDDAGDNNDTPETSKPAVRPQRQSNTPNRATTDMGASRSAVNSSEKSSVAKSRIDKIRNRIKKG